MRIVNVILICSIAFAPLKVLAISAPAIQQVSNQGDMGVSDIPSGVLSCRVGYIAAVSGGADFNGCEISQKNISIEEFIRIMKPGKHIKIMRVVFDTQYQWFYIYYK
jgi:hypothetical protein